MPVMTNAVPQFATTDLELVPARTGIGLKPVHYETILRDKPDIGFFEIHAENYMGAGGPPHRYLAAIREHYPLSVHSVGLSLGGPLAPDEKHLERLSVVVDRYQPGLVSEHLAWSGLDGRFANDLLPLPYTRPSLERTLAHVDRTQTVLGRRVLIENPATYIRCAESDLHECEFLGELAQRSGCGLLLDVNNVYVSSRNHGLSARGYLAAFPLELVDEIHVAGHQPHTDADGSEFLIDSHDQPVSEEVWQLLDETLERAGPLPVLLERDGNIPDWQELAAEASLADSYLQRSAATPKNRLLAHA
jgi:uncharacterized protein (UPF0276 family)